MAKLPKYMSLESTGNPLNFTLKVKNWGIPILIFSAMQELNVKWYCWLLYPKICIKLLRGGING